MAGAVFVVDLKMQAVADEQRTLGQRGGVVLDCGAVPSGQELKLAAVTRIRSSAQPADPAGRCRD